MMLSPIQKEIVETSGNLIVRASAFLQRNNPVLQNGADEVYFNTLQNKALMIKK